MAEHQRIGAAFSAAARTAQANRWAEAFAPTLAEALEAGCVTNTSIARYLNAKGIPTTRGGVWKQQQVKRVLGRLARIIPNR
jgi:hypothetical protein